MTSKEIKNIDNGDKSGYYEIFWLKEIAYQLACLNEREEKAKERPISYIVDLNKDVNPKGPYKTVDAISKDTLYPQEDTPNCRPYLDTIL